MRRPLTFLAAMTCAAGALVIAPPATHAGDVSAPDLAGRYNTYSLRMDNVGYTMKLASTGTPELYDASLKMIFQDGRRGRTINGTVRVNGTRAILRLDGGDAMKGTVGMDGSINFPTCYQELKYASKKTAASTCWFQEFPR